MKRVRHEGGKVWIDGVDRYHHTDPMFEGVRVILSQRGAAFSPEYIQGISGSAFRIGGICPCAPTCDNAMSPEDLLRRLGYAFTRVPLPGKGDDLAAQTRDLVQRVRAEIDAGRAALVWHAFTNAEWDVVFGYDAAKQTFLGRASYGAEDKPYAEKPEGRAATCGKICDPLGAILIGERTGAFEAGAAERDALAEAVRHARSQKNVDRLGGKDWVMLSGLACYDRWIRDWQDPSKKRAVGDAYCYGVYHSTHAAAAPFLREIAPRHPAAAPRLLQAAAHFEAEAKALASAGDLLWWNAPEGPDAARNAKVVPILQQARDAYAAGIAAIAAALTTPAQRQATPAR